MTLNNLLEVLKPYYSITDGWLSLYHRKDSINSKLTQRSYIAKISAIEENKPYSDVSDFNYPYSRLRKSNHIHELFANNLVVEIKDRRDDSLHPELNQKVKIDLGLIPKQVTDKRKDYYKVKSDKSLEKIMFEDSASFQMRWLDLNDYLGDDECVVLSFSYESNVKEDDFKDCEGGIHETTEPTSNLVYETFKSETLLRVTGKIVFKKKNYLRPTYKLKIGYDKDGLINYFPLRKNEKIPSDLQLHQVFFDRRVLTKYEQSEFFDVDAMSLHCVDWNLQIFNNQIDIISVFLPHLISDLPEDEYAHWVAYNVLTAPLDIHMTYCELRTTAVGLPHMPKRSDHRFKLLLTYYLQQCKVSNKAAVFKEFNPIDKPYLNTLNLISENSQWHFDIQILCIVKIMIDSVNLHVLNARGIQDTGKSKNMLKQYLILNNCELTPFNGKFLDNLYELRVGTAHRRGSNNRYEKPFNYFKKIFGNSLILILDGILNECCHLISLLIKIEGLPQFPTKLK